MGIFDRKLRVSDARMAGELLAIRVTLVTLLEAVSADFDVAPELAKFRAAGVLELGELGAADATKEGFVDFMRSFIAAAKRHG
jgi:hypothetical protein